MAEVTVITITVVTASIPQRASSFLPLCIESVNKQTRHPDEHLIAVDHRWRGTSRTLDTVLQGLRTTHFCRLDDDDQYLPNHLEVLEQAALETGADVVYSAAMLAPGSTRGLPPINQPWMGVERLERSNFITAGSALVRTEPAREVGFHPRVRYAEDYGLWLRMARAGCSFHYVPEVTWMYMSGGHDQKTTRKAKHKRRKLFRAL
jgi:hypothetical protein